MTAPVVRETARAIGHRWLCSTVEQLPAAELATPAIVFAPHPDDETLGCGGTVALKRRAGAPVHVVFMTDGARSHARFMDTQELVARREREAIEACTILGVPASAVEFLRFPDGQLGSAFAVAVATVTAILQEHRPPQIFLPYRADGTADHEATYAIVMEAIARAGAEARTFEYAVWAWGSWPWAPCSASARPQQWREAASGVAATMSLVRHFGSYVDVAAVSGVKRRALAAHRTQMEKPPGQPNWPVLSEVHDGEFLRSTLGSREFFAVRTAASPEASTDSAPEIRR